MMDTDTWLGAAAERDEQRRAQRKVDMADLDPVGERPHCWMCRHQLRPYVYHALGDGKKYGYEGNNIFCSLRCGFRWAVNKAT